ncbi:helix-turn-helix transcriptional regulator [Cytophagaceae bacterium DM2B3-1]|uniref:Helix-turn-helix transcriptional regulator n=1 Tax=Xanthocytophaga flava TaxID=3048013 RepID=A0ABT7CLD9_9BACT|nr:helix-turn-helix transcriptional regulator [Xanthocytophaga flavus]MDJ1494564.1 helix-turn-helix transcriptional regulator [Xanthocytophaga flavus]
MKFHERLAQKRKDMGVTQTELAEKIGKSKTAISNYESGRIEPSNEDLVKFAEYFGCSIDYLLTGKEQFSQNETSGFLQEEKVKLENEIKTLLNTIRIMSKQMGKSEASESANRFKSEEEEIMLSEAA